MKNRKGPGKSFTKGFWAWYGSSNWGRTSRAVERFEREEPAAATVPSGHGASQKRRKISLIDLEMHRLAVWPFGMDAMRRNRGKLSLKRPSHRS